MALYMGLPGVVTLLVRGYNSIYSWLGPTFSDQYFDHLPKFTININKRLVIIPFQLILWEWEWIRLLYLHYKTWVFVLCGTCWKNGTISRHPFIPTQGEKCVGYALGGGVQMTKPEMSIDV